MPEHPGARVVPGGFPAVEVEPAPVDGDPRCLDDHEPVAAHQDAEHDPRARYRKPAHSKLGPSQASADTVGTTLDPVEQALRAGGDPLGERRHPFKSASASAPIA